MVKHMLIKNNRLFKILLASTLALSVFFSQAGLLLAQSSESAEVTEQVAASAETDSTLAESDDTSTPIDSSAILVPGSKSLLLDPSDQKLSFGHGNKISPESLDIKSKAILVREIDTANNDLPYDYLSVGATEKIFPASMTKLMTTLLILDAIEAGTVSLDQKHHTTWADLTDLYEQDASVVGLEHNEAMTVRDLLYGTMLSSGNDAANVLTHALSDHILYFVEMMNAKAKEMGLTGTHFANPTGLSDVNNYSTVNDMAKILLACLKHPLFKEIATSKEHTSAPSDEHPEGIEMGHSIHAYADVAEDEIKYIQGGKTGFIEESNYSLASFHEVGTKTYLIITNNAEGAGENVRDHEKLYNALFQEQGPYRLLNKGDLLRTLEVKGAEEETALSFYVGADLDVMLPLTADLGRYQVSLSLPAELKAPLTATQAVGLLTVHDSVRDVELYKQVFTPGIDVKQSSVAYFQDTYLAYVAYAIAGVFLLLLVFLVIRSFRKKAPQSVRSGAHFEDFEG